MQLSLNELLTIKTYDKFAVSWSTDHDDMSHSTHILKKFQQKLPGGSVLEIGAGGSSDCKLLSDAGYSYIGTDAAEGMVKMARQKYPDCQFQVCNLYDVASLGKTFNSFWANAVLLHIEKQRMPVALAAINKVLHENSVGFISLKDGDGEHFEERIVPGRQERRLFSFWRKQEFEEVLEKLGFTVWDYEYHPLNERSKWHWFFVQRNT